MESALREKLRNILGEAPVATITPACAAHGTTAMLSPCVTQIPVVPLVATPGEVTQVQHLPAVPIEAVTELKQNLFCDYRFILLVAISIVCITVALCMMVPRREERDPSEGAMFTEEDDTYVELRERKKEWRRPVLEEDEDGGDEEHTERYKNHTPNVDKPKRRGIATDRIRPDPAHDSRGGAIEVKVGQKVAGESNRLTEKSDPMFQALRK